MISGILGLTIIRLNLWFRAVIVVGLDMLSGRALTRRVTFVPLGVVIIPPTVGLVSRDAIRVRLWVLEFIINMCMSLRAGVGAWWLVRDGRPRFWGL